LRGPIPAATADSRRLTGARAKEIIFFMKAQLAILADPQHRQTALLLVALSVASLVVPSMDQCTRGPSLTAMFLTHLHWFF
jgi:hypothetical protein